MNTHRVTISKFKYYPALSEETNCFTCDVLLDGKKTWSAKNNGHGEETRLYYLKPTTERGDGHDTNAIIEIVDKFVEEAIMEKKKEKDLKAVKRKFAKALFFRIKGQKPDSYYFIKTPTPNDALVRDRAFKKHDIDVIINDLPIEQAVHYFFKYE